VAYFIVFLVAAVAGCGVGWLTLRDGRVATTNPEAWTGTFRGREGEAATDPTEPGRRGLPPDPNAQTRVIGAAGLAGAVIAGAGVIAFLAYLVWTAMKGVFS
jgi:hypothetical protein